jgi:uncharacterized protein
MRGLKSAMWLVGIVAVSVSGLVISSLPEFMLFRERLAFSLFEFHARVDLEPFDMKTRDGLVLRSWYYAPSEGRPVIVYFPGRAGDIIKKPSHLFDLAEQGYGLMLAGYRGYGGNPGQPSERRFYEDATDLLLQLEEKEKAPGGIVLYGYSMGTGIASYVASTARSRGVILEAPFTSFRDVVSFNAWPAPVWLVRTGFDTQSRIARIDAPILLLAGQYDSVTPPAFAEMLSSIASSVASLQILDGAGHADMFEHGAWEQLTGFLDLLQASTIPSAEAGELVAP